MTNDELVAHIFSRGRFGMKPGLERVSAILSRLGNPHRTLRSVQIAGTNGKGSTGAFLSAIMTACGCRTAFFSSPHLSRFGERYRINDAEVADAPLLAAARRVLDAAAPEATFFEIVTAIAFLLFAEADVELAIMEAGMGGRWDATNVASSLLAIITPISLDHCAYLGDTPAAIAVEKAGIIKPGAPVVIAQQEPAALAPLLAAAESAAVPAFLAGRDFTFEARSSGGRFTGNGLTIDTLELSLRGRYQQTNAASAAMAASLLGDSGFAVTGSAIRTGLANAFWPGRLELFEGNPPVLLDGAHNPAGAAALSEALADFRYRKLILVVGMMADKAWQETLRNILPRADRVVAVAPQMDRSLSVEDIGAFCRDYGVNTVTAERVGAGLDRAKELAEPGDLVLVTGSLFTVGEARSLLTGNDFMPVRG